jgi:hypothetical protein
LNLFHTGFAFFQRIAKNKDPLVENANWVALMIGTHLPLWPLYVLWAAGRQAWPTSLWTITFTPFFLLVVPISRKNGLLGRIVLVVVAIVNTIFTRGVLGPDTGTELFLVPCAMLAAILFRRSERWLMIFFSMVPILVWYLLRGFTLVGPHLYDNEGAHGLFVLNLISVSVLITAFGWLQANVYQRMEKSG